MTDNDPSTTDTEQCERCDGTGRAVAKREAGLMGQMWEMEGPCSACGGDGRA